jgi:restriction system protein
MRRGVYQISLLSFPVFFQWTFTADAAAEARRDGAPPIDLIDGNRLCDLLKEFGVGVTTTPRVVEDVAVHPECFTSLEPK